MSVSTPILILASRAGCARVTNGHTAAEPAISLMTSRRCNAFPPEDDDPISNGMVAPCPLWVKSRHMRCNSPCPLYPKSGHMRCNYGCPLWAKSGPMQRSKGSLFDHLVGATLHRLRHGNAERLGGLEVDDQFDFRCLLDR